MIMSRVLILVMCAALAGCGGDSATSPTGESDQQAVQKQTAPVTLATYNGIKTGMTYKQVVQLVGSEGTEVGSSEMAGIKTDMYSWSNPDFSNMTLTFQNGKLMGKTKMNLK